MPQLLHKSVVANCVPQGRFVVWITALTLTLMTASQCRGQTAAATEPRNSIVAESALLRLIDQVAIPARASGIIASIQVKEGDLVKKGALLAKVDDAEEDLIYQRAVIEYELATQRATNDVAIRAAEKALNFSQQEYQRLNRASEGIPGSVSKSQLEESRVTAEQAELELEKARHENELEIQNKRLKAAEQAVALHNKQIHQILAPINGMVVEILRKQGEWVEPGEDVLRVIRIDRLRAEGLVPFQHVTTSLVGSKVEVAVSIPDRSEVVATGQIVFVNPELNPVNGRVRVRAEFDNPAGQLMPGMRARMVIHPQHATNSQPAPKATQISSPTANESNHEPRP